jgi:hypothetical protein
MICKKDTPAKLVTVSVERGEELDLAGLDVMIQNVMLDPVGYWAVELVLAPQAMNNHVNALTKRGFVISGNLSIDNTIFMRLRKNLQSPSFSDTPRSTYNPDLATQAPVLQPTPAEVSARVGLNASLERHYSDDAVTRRLTQIEAEGATRRSQRDSHKDVESQAERLAKVIMRKPEPFED